MNIKSKVFGIVGAALISLSLIGGAAANTTADVNVEVTSSGGTLSASITGANFSAVPYRAGNGSQNSTGKVTVVATDTRGVGSGWTVTIQSNGDFKTNAGDRSFAVNNFSLQSGSTQGKDNANVNNIQCQAVAISTSPQTIMTAQRGYGLGTFENTINATIAVPDNTLVGTYKTTLTVSITASN